MIAKFAVIVGAVGLSVPAAAQVSNTFNPNFVFQQTLPMVTSPCKGGTCSRNATSGRAGPAKGNDANARATCVNARKMTPKPADRAKMARLLSICDDAGY